MPVKRNYAFERLDIPSGEQYVLKINYPFKVKAGSGYHSCCIIVKNMQRCVYAIPKDSVFDSINIAGRNSPKSQMSESTLGGTLQDMASELKNEIAQQLLNINVSTYSMMPVKRNYAFERSDIPSGEQYVLKINYPFKDPPLPADLRGKKFLALLGTHTSSLELFIIKRKIKGPSWLSISKFMICPAGQRVSWCKFEIIVDCPKDIRISTSKTLLDPPVVVTAINLETVIKEKNNGNEIVTASIVCCHKAKVWKCFDKQADKSKEFFPPVYLLARFKLVIFVLPWQGFVPQSGQDW
ncbi:DNA polymerase alpha catalytic subunit-like [Zingiber officinale]|uniref:DNA polymerase alpha catalytic subunit-like n=1 Tax=Zingiber officinale TaxID=94328 RepID=UPI001C4C796D|nr:DNA polymerase alpha catalytic subunit-like [Zingiber officinale]